MRQQSVPTAEAETALLALNTVEDAPAEELSSPSIQQCSESVALEVEPEAAIQVHVAEVAEGAPAAKDVQTLVGQVGRH